MHVLRKMKRPRINKLGNEKNRDSIENTRFKAYTKQC